MDAMSGERTIEADTRQRMMRRANTSITNAT